LKVEKNADDVTIESFNSEWVHFDQSALSEEEHEKLYLAYFEIFPFNELPEDAEGFDMGCGTGRWARRVAPRVGKLNCIDPALGALDVARKNLSSTNNVNFINAGVSDNALPRQSQDFGYSLGVLHHIPDTYEAMRSCVELLKPGAPFLVYLYYNFENRPRWFRNVWRMSELIRTAVSKLPDKSKVVVTDFLAAGIYWPLARFSRLLEALKIDPSFMPLSNYRCSSFYTMRTDSRDRFGTPLEQRFSRAEITDMMTRCGLTAIVFSETEPYWVALGRKSL